LARKYHCYIRGSNFSVGIDTMPVIIPLREFGLEYHQTLPGLPQYPAVQSAPAKRLLMSWWEREVWIWRICRPDCQPSRVDEAAVSPGGRKLVAKITLSVCSLPLMADLGATLADITGHRAKRALPRLPSRQLAMSSRFRQLLMSRFSV
jgi:hypothetical protein